MVRGGVRRAWRPVAAGISVLLVAAACAKSSTAPPLQVGGLAGFDEHQAVLANGAIPEPDAGLACGSTTQEFGTEFLNTSPQNAHVLREWGEIVPGRQMYVGGTVAKVEFSHGDLQFDHPFGLDFSFDVKPDRPFAGLARSVGTAAPEGGPPGTIHMEISEGLVPHTNGTSYAPGVIPSVGDRVAAYGRWIIDCGHGDFHTEIHPTTFLAFGHREGSATVVHTFYNPYYETQLYTPEADTAARTEDARRFGAADTSPLPAYLYHQILRLLHVGNPGPAGFLDRLEAHILLQANTASRITWYQCPPGGARSKGSVAYSYYFVTRPGVRISATPDERTGCVGITASIGRSYRALDPQRKDCVDPWTELNAQAQAALGSRNIDVLAAFQKQVPPSFRSRIARDPVVDCYDPLTVPDIGSPGRGRRVQMSASQPFPFYGWIRVSR
jgi:hypothetical protein